MVKNKIYLLSSIFLLNIIGLVSLYSALHTNGNLANISLFHKQIIWIIAGWVILLILYKINYRILFDLCPWIFGLALFLLLIVVAFGEEYMGSQRWISIFGVNFQPSEFAKLAGILILARSFARQSQKANSSGIMKSFYDEIIIPFIPIASLSFLIFIQPDLGTSTILIILYILVLITASEVKKRNIIIFCSIILAVIPIGWLLLKDYQKDRLLVFINPNSDPLGAGYTIIQSKIAIGSGEIWGKGFLAGTQNQLNFLPASHTDFIFTVFAEEWGLIGCIFALSVYYLMLQIILKTALSSPDRYSYFVCMGIFTLFFIHIFVNLSMIMGLLPVVGLPLPFMSYGGSFTIISFLLIGLVLSIQNNTIVK